MAKLDTYSRSSYVGEEIQRLAGFTVYNVLTYGAPTDGTSDCTAAVQAAINAALAAGGGTIYFPAGTYTFALASAALNPGAGNLKFVGDGMDRSILYFDGGTDTSFATFKCLFRNTSGGTKYPVEFEDLQMRGAFPTRVNTGGPAIALDNYPFIGLRRVKFKDLPCFATQCESIDEVSVQECTFDTVFRDQVRFRSSRNVRVINNYFKNSTDDSIALHQAFYVTGSGNIRERIVIQGNIFEDTTGVHCLGGRSIIVSGNIFHRCKIGCIRINAGDVDEPSHGTFGIIVTDNYCYDTWYGSSTSTPAGGAISITSPAAYAGTDPSSLKPGDVDSATGELEPPYDYRENVASDATKSYPPMYGVVISDNIIARTLPAVTNYSDWGFGETLILASLGFDDPAITDDVLRTTAGIVMTSNTVGFQIADNVIMNCRRGIYFFDDPSETNMLGRIAGNQVFDCWEYGIWFSIGSGARHLQVQITDNQFNLDPYFVATGRQSDGSWSGSPTTRGITFAGATANGLVIRDNIFQNCYLVFGGGIGNNIIRDNIIKGEIAAFGTSSSNKGIGQSLAAGERFTYLQMDQTRTSGTYGEVQGGPGGQYSAQPSTGFWVRGEWVPNSDPASTAVLGWVRLTTGSSHVAGTDWKKVDIT